MCARERKKERDRESMCVCVLRLVTAFRLLYVHFVQVFQLTKLLYLLYTGFGPMWKINNDRMKTKKTKCTQNDFIERGCISSLSSNYLLPFIVFCHRTKSIALQFFPFTGLHFPFTGWIFIQIQLSSLNVSSKLNHFFQPIQLRNSSSLSEEEKWN